MAVLMRCTTSHWQGNEFIAQGTLVPEGDPRIIDAFFSRYEIAEPAKRTARRGS